MSQLSELELELEKANAEWRALIQKRAELTTELNAQIARARHQMQFIKLRYQKERNANPPPMKHNFKR